jgi:tetratricopeptide (TPR) repeat protein
MVRAILAGALVVFCASAALADYVSDRRAAVALAAAGKQEEALAAFLKMAEGEVSPFQKSDALEQAAQCALRLKKVDEALKLAQRIPTAPISKTCQMRILAAGRKWAEVVDLSKDDDFTAWPDEFKAEAFHLRGQSRGFLRDGKGAEADLAKAVETYPYSFNKGQAALALGDNYRDNLKDDAQAVAAYLKAYEYVRDPNSYITCSALIAAAGLLQKQGRNDEAAQTLQKIDTAKMTGYWRARMLDAQGQALAAQGKTAEALAKYNEALAVKDIPDYFRKECEKRVQVLQEKGR